MKMVRVKFDEVLPNEYPYVKYDDREGDIFFEYGIEDLDEVEEDRTKDMMIPFSRKTFDMSPNGVIASIVNTLDVDSWTVDEVYTISPEGDCSPLGGSYTYKATWSYATALTHDMVALFYSKIGKDATDWENEKANYENDTFIYMQELDVDGITILDEVAVPRSSIYNVASHIASQVVTLECGHAWAHMNSSSEGSIITMETPLMCPTCWYDNIGNSAALVAIEIANDYNFMFTKNDIGFDNNALIRTVTRQVQEVMFLDNYIEFAKKDQMLIGMQSGGDDQGNLVLVGATKLSKKNQYTHFQEIYLASGGCDIRIDYFNSDTKEKRIWNGHREDDTWTVSDILNEDPLIIDEA